MSNIDQDTPNPWGVFGAIGGLISKPLGAIGDAASQTVEALRDGEISPRDALGIVGAVAGGALAGGVAAFFVTGAVAVGVTGLILGTVAVPVGIAVGHLLFDTVTEGPQTYDQQVDELMEQLEDPLDISEGLDDLIGSAGEVILWSMQADPKADNGDNGNPLIPDPGRLDRIRRLVEEIERERNESQTNSDNEDDDDPSSPGRGDPTPHPSGGSYEYDGTTYQDVWEAAIDNGHHVTSGGAINENGHSGNNGKSDAEDPRDWSTAWPLILDLDGDGVEVSFGNGVSFDIDDDGYREEISWAAADDGFLVIDLDADGNMSAGGGDGDITRGRELAFALWSDADLTDLQALAEAVDEDDNLIFDTNGDGLLNASDDVWASMKVWQDGDQDGEVDDGELQHLEDHGITEIVLSYDDGSAFEDSDDDIEVFGNTLHGLASFVQHGELVEGAVGDISLEYSVHGWRRTETTDGLSFDLEVGDGDSDWHAGSTDGNDDVVLRDGDFNTASGNAADNVLDARGLDGESVLNGAEGSDTIHGGAGADLIAGGAGADQVHGGAGSDIIFGDLMDDIAGGAINGGSGYDMLIMEEDAGLQVSDLATIGFEAVQAGNIDDLLIGTSDDVGYNLSGAGGNDELRSAGGSDVLNGGDGDDILDAGRGADRLYGGDGDNILDAGIGNDLLEAGDGNSTLTGGAGDDVYVISGAGHKVINETGIGQSALVLSDVAFHAVSFTAAESDVMVLTWQTEDGEDASLTINGWSAFGGFSFDGGATQYRETYLHDDGYLVFQGQEASDTVALSAELSENFYLRGQDGDDILVADADITVAGWNYMDGLAGNDVYAHHRVTGDLRVTDYSETADGGTDVFMIEDVDLSEIELTENGNWLQFRFFGGTVQFEDDGQHMEYFRFADDPDTLYYGDWQSGSPHLAEVIA